MEPEGEADFVPSPSVRPATRPTMADSLADLLETLRARPPADEPPAVVEGALDPHRSDQRHLLFTTRPPGGPWIRVPAGAVASAHLLEDVRSGPVAWPRVRLTLDPSDPATPTVVDAVRASSRPAAATGWPGGSGARLGGGEDDDGASHDVSVEMTPTGRLYRIKLEVEGHDVRDVSWDGERKVYVASIPGLPVEDALDVSLAAWGSEGAALSCVLEIDGRRLDPPLEVRVSEGPGEARRSYRL